jgi:signal peptidase I
VAAAALGVGLVLVPVLVAEPVRVGSGSMAPTYPAGQHVLVAKLGARAHHPHRGDIVAFHLPDLPDLLVKRVVAVAGDTVGIEDGVLVVNGQPRQESYVDYSTVDSTYFGPVAVPAGAVFALGDDRANSVDSRRFGPVPVADIVGRVVARVWPP